MALQAQVRLIRFQSFDGTNIQFTDNFTLVSESLPLASTYYTVAQQLPALRLCKATVLEGVIIVLEPTRIMGSGAPYVDKETKFKVSDRVFIESGSATIPLQPPSGPGTPNISAIEAVVMGVRAHGGVTQYKVRLENREVWLSEQSIHATAAEADAATAELFRRI